RRGRVLGEPGRDRLPERSDDEPGERQPRGQPAGVRAPRAEAAITSWPDCHQNTGAAGGLGVSSNAVLMLTSADTCVAVGGEVLLACSEGAARLLLVIGQTCAHNERR